MSEVRHAQHTMCTIRVVDGNLDVYSDLVVRVAKLRPLEQRPWTVDLGAAIEISLPVKECGGMRLSWGLP